MIEKLIAAAGWVHTTQTVEDIQTFLKAVRKGEYEEERREDGYYHFLGIVRFKPHTEGRWLARGILHPEREVEESWLVGVLSLTDMMTKVGHGMQVHAEHMKKAREDHEDREERHSWN